MRKTGLKGPGSTAALKSSCCKAESAHRPSDEFPQTHPEGFYVPRRFYRELYTVVAKPSPNLTRLVHGHGRGCILFAVASCAAASAFSLILFVISSVRRLLFRESSNQCTSFMASARDMAESSLFVSCPKRPRNSCILRFSYFDALPGLFSCQSSHPKYPNSSAIGPIVTAMASMISAVIRRHRARAESALSSETPPRIWSLGEGSSVRIMYRDLIA